MIQIEQAVTRNAIIDQLKSLSQIDYLRRLEAYKRKQIEEDSSLRILDTLKLKAPYKFSSIIPRDNFTNSILDLKLSTFIRTYLKEKPCVITYQIPEGNTHEIIDPTSICPRITIKFSEKDKFPRHIIFKNFKKGFQTQVEEAIALYSDMDIQKLLRHFDDYRIPCIIEQFHEKECTFSFHNTNLCMRINNH